MAAAGEPFVPAGPSDDIGRPTATLPRLGLALDAIGYRSKLDTKAAPGGFIIVATLTPYDRVRYVFVTGNRPIRQDEIQRRITIRAGRPLPPAGPERVAALERERERVIDFMPAASPPAVAEPDAAVVPEPVRVPLPVMPLEVVPVAEPEVERASCSVAPVDVRPPAIAAPPAAMPPAAAPAVPVCLPDSASPAPVCCCGTSRCCCCGDVEPCCRP